ncbi:MAG TPA: hypothetical protein VJT12_06190, partial [Methyloceanibacter sp.]|nr:hypothetical protein [Methyloceanibacter sp.]
MARGIRLGTVDRPAREERRENEANANRTQHTSPVSPATTRAATRKFPRHAAIFALARDDDLRRRAASEKSFRYAVLCFA